MNHFCGIKQISDPSIKMKNDVEIKKKKKIEYSWQRPWKLPDQNTNELFIMLDRYGRIFFKAIKTECHRCFLNLTQAFQP